MPRLISLYPIEPILPFIEAGHLILTPNQRLASRIQTSHGIYCRERGKKVVATPLVLSLNSWIEQCWGELLLNASALALEFKPLTVSQELLLWEQVVGQSNLGAALLRPAATAQQAAGAYRTMVEWQQDFADESLRQLFSADDDSHTFLGWVESFEALCAEGGWMSGTRRIERIIAGMQNGDIETVGSIVGIGFEDIAPLQSALLAAAGNFEHLQYQPEAGSVTVCSCDSAKQELQAAAVWAKQVLRNDPEATVAIVVPDLAQQRHTVQRILLEVFDPGFNQPLSGEQQNLRRSLPFNFSAGYPLLEAPLIQSALDLLALNQPAVDVGTVEAVLLSPFVCLDPSDAEEVSQLLALVRQDRDFTISGSRLRHLATRAGDYVAKNRADRGRISADPDEPNTESNAEANPEPSDENWHFSDALQTQATLFRAGPGSNDPDIFEWIKLLQKLLQAVGWPGKRALDSIEFQQMQHWELALQEMLSLSSIVDVKGGKMNFAQLLTRLRGILSRQIFQPQTADSALQVLGTLEAGGLQFSHIWLQSMSEQQWPPAPQPNPLLPFSLQRDCRMPHATASRELEYASNLSARFIRSAGQIIVSHAKLIDENPAAVSGLFRSYPIKSIDQLLGRPLEALLPFIEIRRRHLESAKHETLHPGDGPALSDREKVRGGSSLLSSQSACGFRAYAKHRLGLRELPEPELGLSARDRGSLVHRALELCWETLKNQQGLLQLDSSQQDKLVGEVAEYALAELSQRRSTRLGPRYHELEKQRLQRLLNDWLEVEKGRADFSVESLESRKVFLLGELELETRVDRIDRLADGSLLIIDYKTGKCSINQWWGERPDDPQLPLYSMLTEKPVLNGEDSVNAGDESESKSVVKSSVVKNTEDQTSEVQDLQSANNVGGIAFAQVTIDGSRIKGVGAEALSEPSVQWQDKVKTDAGVLDWPQLKQHWTRVLTSLAEDFIAGKAAVEPKNPPQTCQYCELSSVCRVHHQEHQS